MGNWLANSSTSCRSCASSASPDCSFRCAPKALSLPSPGVDALSRCEIFTPLQTEGTARHSASAYAWIAWPTQ